MTKKLNLQCPIGTISIEVIDRVIHKLDFINSSKKPALTINEDPIQAKVLNYFKCGQALSAPLYVTGSDFQVQVWEALRNIPFGQTRTYGQLASQLNTSARAIGQACKRNPIPLFIPCHRVVAAENLGGFSGYRSGTMLNIKVQLLAHEAKFRE